MTKYIHWKNPLSKREFLYRVVDEDPATYHTNLAVGQGPDGKYFTFNGDVIMKFGKRDNNPTDDRTAMRMFLATTK